MFFNNANACWKFLAFALFLSALAGLAGAGQTSTFYVDAGLGKSCPVAITREMASATNLSTLTTMLENTGGSGCSLADFEFVDTIPSDFPALSEVAFTPQYASRDGWAVTFSFPTFEAGESKTLTYSASQWIRTSLARSFTAYNMSAKRQQAAAEPAVPAPAPAPEETSAWVPRKLPPLPPSQPAAKPDAAPAAPPAQPDGFGALAFAALVAIAMLAGIAAVAAGLKGKQKKSH